MRDVELTLHSKKRIKSRFGLSDPKKQRELVLKAFNFGERVENETHCIKVIYEDYVFIFGKNNKKLITMYERNERDD